MEGFIKNGAGRQCVCNVQDRSKRAQYSDRPDHRDPRHGKSTLTTWLGEELAGCARRVLDGYG